MEENVMASTALQFCGELKKDKLIFRVRIWIEAIGSTPERWLDDFQTVSLTIGILITFVKP